MDVYDMTIVGGGPTGLFAAFYASGMRNMKTKIIEALPQLGGQLSVLYPDKYVYDVPGFPKVLAKDLVKYLVEQALQFNPKVHLNERLLELNRLSNGVIELITDKGVHFSKTVLIAAGLGAFAPKKLDRPGLNRLEGKGVYYVVTDKWAFKDKRILIVGGGDSAVDWALNLKDIAKHVILIHRRHGFRAHEGSVAELFRSPVEVMIPYEVKEAHGEDRLEKVTIFNNQTREEMTLDVDALIIQIGFNIDLTTIKRWGLKMNGDAIMVNSKMETSMPGVYAAGDVAGPKDVDRLKLIAVGFAQAAIAVNYAKTYIDPKERVFPGHSSEKRF